MKPTIIAPCGMNCNLCIAYLREKNKCPGCNLQGNPDSDYFKKCSIKNCDIIRDNKWKFCSPKCNKFPCQRLKSLDKRYKTKYGMSMIENLKFILEYGIRQFITREKQRWTKGDKIFCVHKRGYIDQRTNALKKTVDS
jgi:hypothetical protein